MEVAGGKAAVDHDGKHLDEAERLALADSTGKAVHDNSMLLQQCILILTKLSASCLSHHFL